MEIDSPCAHVMVCLSTQQHNASEGMTMGANKEEFMPITRDEQNRWSLGDHRLVYGERLYLLQGKRLIQARWAETGGGAPLVTIMVQCAGDTSWKITGYANEGMLARRRK